MRKDIQHVHRFWDWAVSAGLIQVDPSLRLKMQMGDGAASQHKESFDQDGLDHLWLSLADVDEDQRWLILLTAYSGARPPKELTDLRKSDFKPKYNGQPHLWIQSWKCKADDAYAWRHVPIHKDLIEAGILKWIATKRDRLFPFDEDEAQNWYRQHAKQHRITKTMYCLRGMWRLFAKHAGLDDETINRLQGRKPITVDHAS
jgi:hypothetical protein